MLPLMALPALFQGGLGLLQSITGAGMSAQRPTYKMPSFVSEGLSAARNQASSQMPGMQLAQQNIGRNASNATSGISQMGNSSSNKLAALGGVQQNSNNATNALAQQNASYQAQQMKNLQQQLNHAGTYQDKEFEYNQNQPYQNAAAAKSAMTQGGIKNLFGGLTGAASAQLAGGLGGNAAGAAPAATQSMGSAPSAPAFGMGATTGMNQVNGIPQGFDMNWMMKGFNMQ